MLHSPDPCARFKKTSETAPFSHAGAALGKRKFTEDMAGISLKGDLSVDGKTSVTCAAGRVCVFPCSIDEYDMSESKRERA